MSRRSWWIALGLLALLVAGLAWAGLRAARDRRLRAELDLAMREFEAGRVYNAARALNQLAERWPNHPEVQFRLGVCEQARGRLDDALKAWDRVPDHSEFAPRAAERRADGLINVGRYSDAEAALDAVGPDPTPADAFALSRARARLYRFQGRVPDLRRVLRASIHLAPAPADLLRELWLLDHSPQPVEAWQVALDHADPDDDRVWLGRANLAALTGRLDEAATWFARCLDRRPGDPAILRGALDRAAAAVDHDALARIAHALPAAALTPIELLELRAKLAAAIGPDTERTALQALLTANPGDSPAWVRLATLAADSGDHPEADRCRRRKAELDNAYDHYRKVLLSPETMMDHLPELASLARELGRPLDAQVWGALRDGAPAPRQETPRVDSSDRLADLIQDLLLPSRPDAPSAAPFVTPLFTDEAEAAGLRFVFDNGASAARLLPETMSGGVGLLDYDRDGWLDVFVVQGGPLAAVGPDATPRTDRLFRNTGHGRFVDVTEAAGIAALPRAYGLGVAVGDYDNDGWPDLFLSRLDSYLLLRNNGDGAFVDVTNSAGLAGRRDNPTSAAFADLDNDGDLDLYVCHYMIWDPNDPRTCLHEDGRAFYCDPSKVDPAPDRLFRNDNGRFVDVSDAAGITAADTDGRGLGVIAADLDDDGRLDLYVANDGTANFLFHNQGAFRFEEIGHLAGVAGGADGGYQAGMGVACVDLDDDARLDLLVTNFYGESTTLYRNLGDMAFSDQTAPSGVGAATRYLLGFGIVPLDYDNDGDPDLMTANGHVNDNRPYYPYAMPASLLANLDGARRLVDVSRAAGSPWSVPRLGRGLAAGDLDHDGRVDAVLLPQNEPLALFRNQTPGGHALVLRLEGTRSNRDAVGAKVTITTTDRRQHAHRIGGGSYQSASAPELHFGLGAADHADAIDVQWPSGQRDHHEHVPADAAYRLREAAPALELLHPLRPTNGP